MEDRIPLGMTQHSTESTERTEGWFRPCSPLAIDHRNLNSMSTISHTSSSSSMMLVLSSHTIYHAWHYLSPSIINPSNVLDGVAVLKEELMTKEVGDIP